MEEKNKPQLGPPVDLFASKLSVELGNDGLPTSFAVYPDKSKVTSRDQRELMMADVDAVIQRFKDEKVKLYIDANHAEFDWNVPNDRKHAYGWIGKLEKIGKYGLRCSDIEWTPRGAEALKNKDFRYISPAFAMQVEYDEDWNVTKREIYKLLNVGLTNNPALTLPALASYRHDTQEKASKNMDPKILELLGLNEGASAEDVAAAISKMKTQTADSSSSVPRQDYEMLQAKLRLTNERIEQVEIASRQDTAKVEVEKAIASKRIAPKSREDWEKFCAESDEKLEFFRKMVAEMNPVIPAASKSNMTTPPQSIETHAANEEQEQNPNWELSDRDLMSISVRNGGQITVEELKKNMARIIELDGYEGELS